METNNTRKIYIFILTSPIGILNAEKVIEIYINSNEKTVLFIDSKYSNYTPHYWSEVIKIENFITSDQFRTALNRKDVLKFIKNEYSNFEEYNFYVMDFDAITNNIVNFFLCKKKQVNIIEDGLVNYIKSYPKNNNIVMQIIKVLYYRLIGIKTRIFFGTVTGIETNSISTQFLKYPELSVYPNKTLPIGFEKIKYVPCAKTILILGQTMERNNENVYREVLKKLIELIRMKFKNTEIQILYKPHRWEDWIITDIIQEFSIHLIKDLNPIESIIADIKPKYIYSFGSSALINISMSLDDNVRKEVEVNSYPYLEFNIYKNILPLFVKANVNILQI